MPPAHRGSIALAALTVLVAASGPAHADAPGGDARAQADAEFAEGKKLLDDGQTAAACVRFAKSQDLDPKLGRLLNLAFCHEQEGKTTSAWNEYNAAAAMAAQKGQPDRVDFAREHATDVAKRLSFLHLDVPTGADAVEVDGAGVPRDRWAMPLPLDPGDHEVVVTAANKKPAVLSVRVATEPGVQEATVPPLEDARASAAPATPNAASASTPGTDAGSGHPSRVPFYVAGGVAILGLGVGIVGGVQAISKKGEADPQCPAKECSPSGRALLSDAQTAATLSTVGFGVGLAGAAAAVWLFLRSSPSSDARAARLVPIVGVGSTGTTGLRLEGTW